MKKTVSLLIIPVLIFCLTGCGSSSTEPEKMITMAAEQEPSRIVFTYREEQIIPGGNMPQKAVDSAISAEEVAGCIGNGIETIYEFEDFTVTAYEQGEKNVVYSIYFSSEQIETTEGLSIGDSQQTILDLYGEPATQGGYAWIYSDGTTDLILLLSENTVVGIEYRMAG